MLIGRDYELAALNAAFDSVLDPNGDQSARQVLALVGDPGMGKTSLLGHLRMRAQAADLMVLSANGIETEQRIGFAGLSDLLLPITHLIGSLPIHQSEALAGSLALGPPVDGGQLAISAATLGILHRAAERGPVVIVVEKERSSRGELVRCISGGDVADVDKFVVVPGEGRDGTTVDVGQVGGLGDCGHTKPPVG